MEKEKKLPKYDWPEKLVYETPATHRIFTKETGVDKKNLVTVDDHHFVVVRPKAIIGSSDTVWATVKQLDYAKNNQIYSRYQLEIVG